MNDPNANRLPIIGSDPIIDFYLGKAPDGAGRCIEEIWKFGHERLERVHDYIQWLFPLPDKSPFNRDAPVLTPKTIRAFRESDWLRARLARSVEVMLDFYGLQSMPTEGGNLIIVKGVTFESKAEAWLEQENHNHLRLSRILASTRILGLEVFSRALFTCLSEIYQAHKDKISSRTYQFWTAAAS
jgi:hypothetical protein